MHNVIYSEVVVYKGMVDLYYQQQKDIAGSVYRFQRSCVNSQSELPLT